jgi:hypothetical protein
MSELPVLDSSSERTSSDDAPLIALEGVEKTYRMGKVD